MDLAGKIRRIRGFCNAGLDELRITGDAGQRRFQLVADIGRELLPHFLVIFPQHPVRVDAFSKGDKLLVGDILLDVIEVIGHLEHRLDKALVSSPAMMAAAPIIRKQLSTMAGRAAS